MKSFNKALKTIFTASLLSALHKNKSVEKKAPILLIVSIAGVPNLFVAVCHLWSYFAAAYHLI